MKGVSNTTPLIYLSKSSLLHLLKTLHQSVLISEEVYKEAVIKGESRGYKAISKIVQMENNDIRAEYSFTGGVRGKHYRAMQAGYTITIHKEDGTTYPAVDIAP